MGPEQFKAFMERVLKQIPEEGWVQTSAVIQAFESEPDGNGRGDAKAAVLALKEAGRVFDGAGQLCRLVTSEDVELTVGRKQLQELFRIYSEVRDILGDLVFIGPLTFFSFEFRAIFLKGRGPAIRLIRSCACVEELGTTKGFQFDAVVDPEHPMAKDDLPTYVRALARDLVCRALIHEVDEGLRIDGIEHVVSPHPGGQRDTLGSYIKWPIVDSKCP